jgi:hydrogenase maturation protease
MTAETVLVAGVGNVFFGDDGFGVEVVRRLAQRELPSHVKVADFGIRGVHLAYEMLNGYERTIIVDAVARGEPPGTVYVIEPDAAEIAAHVREAAAGAEAPLIDAHGLDPASVLALSQHLDGSTGEVIIVGCEPAEITERMGLSAVVEAAVEPAIELVKDLLSVQESRSGTATHRR